MSLNQWLLSGRLARDPWVADSGKVVKITLAVSRGIPNEKVRKAQEAGNKIKDTDFFELTLFKQSKGRDNSGFFNLVAGLKTGDFVSVTVKPENSEPQRRTNKEGIPEIVYRDLYLIQKINDIVRYNGAGNVTVPDEDIEDDPIVTQAQTQTTSQNEDIPSDW